MYLTQNWCLQYIQGLTSCYIPLIYINNYKFNTVIQINWTEILSNASIIQNKRGLEICVNDLWKDICFKHNHLNIAQAKEQAIKYYKTA